MICCVVRSTVTRPTSDSRSTGVGWTLENVHVVLVDPDHPTEPERAVDQQVDLCHIGAAQSPCVVEDGVEDLLLGGRGSREHRKHLDDRRQLRAGAGLGVEQQGSLEGLGAGVVVHVGLPVTG